MLKQLLQYKITWGTNLVLKVKDITGVFEPATNTGVSSATTATITLSGAPSGGTGGFTIPAGSSPGETITGASSDGSPTAEVVAWNSSNNTLAVLGGMCQEHLVMVLPLLVELLVQVELLHPPLHLFPLVTELSLVQFKQRLFL